MRKTLLITCIGLLVFAIVAWFIGTFVTVTGTSRWILRGALWLIGIIAAAVVVWFLGKKQKQGHAPMAGLDAAAGGEEIDLLIRDAEAKLSAAGLGRTRNLPAIFLVGEAGGAKTSTVVHSGLEPELLAGQVFQDTTIVPTGSANLWLAGRVLFAEFGGKLFADPPKWARLVKRLEPSKLSTLVGKGGQAPRAALVCVDGERFIRGGSAEATTSAARNLRQRLGEVSQILGINLPVYVLFTRMDRAPFFMEFVRNLSNDEARQVLGVSLPMASGPAAGVYAERETTRLNGAFDELFRSLCGARPELLVRENDAAQLPGIYEFPREFRKLRPALVQFLMELCRPSQLAAGPFLRGFYFSGVRPIVVNEVAPAYQRAQETEAAATAPDATRMFRVGTTPLSAPQPAAPPVVATRKVPQWVFLSHLFQHVLLQDRIAMGASGSSTKTSLLRRVLLVTAGVLCLALSIGFIVSFSRNHALESEVKQSALGISSAESAGVNVASVDALRRLDALRQTLQVLTTYNREGAPLSYRWGLYAGDTLYPDVRKLYFDRFYQLLLGQTQAGMLDSLRRLPPAPGPPYGETYDTLKAYLITTSHHEKSTRSFLAPALLNRWSAGRNVGADRMQLAQKQFEFYSDELQVANPFTNDNDGVAIEKARRYLSQFAGFERVYQAMLTDAGKTSPPINFNKRFPGSAEVVVDNREVAGPFTKAAWDFMQNAIRNPDRYFSGEQWVLGDQGPANIDRSKLGQQLQDRYYQDFVAQWRAFLKSASVVKYKDLKDASQKLNLLSGNQSPLLALLWLASQNTAVDAPAVANAFQPVQAVVPPASVDRYIAPPNQNYMNALVTLQTSLEGVADLHPIPEPAAGQTLNNATAARIATRQVAQAFRIDPDAHIEAVVQKLMEEPITNAETLLRGAGPAELNAGGKGLCAEMRTLWTKYPFKPTATTDATVADVNAIFHKPEGKLWAFYDASLAKLLVKQGTLFVAVPNPAVTLTPAFVNFFNQAAALSDAFYAGDAPEPHLSYSLKPLPTEGIQNMSIILRVDGQTLTYSGGVAKPQPLVWRAAGTNAVKASLKFPGSPDIDWSTISGLWAVFHFFDDAERSQPFLQWIPHIGRGGGPLSVEGKPVTVNFELDMGGAPPVFQKGYFAKVSCISEVAK